jgi:F-type H+-transporting ATPase subunit delta
MGSTLPEFDTQTIVTGDAALVARRYAGALYDLAQDQKKLDAVANDLRDLQRCCFESAELRYVLSQPRLSRKQMLETMAKLSAALKCDPLTTNFLGLLAKNRRLSSLQSIMQAFMAELAERRGEYTADIVVARPMPEELKGQLATRLRELAGGNVHLSMREDKSILGGMIVKVGSQLFDASLKTKLARLERYMKSDQSGIHKGAA